MDRLDIGDERSHDSDHFRNGSWLEERLLLIDLRYFKYLRFARIDENSGYFVSPLKRGADPAILAELRTWRGSAGPLVGEHVSAVIGNLHPQEVDVLVEVSFNRRILAGTRSSDTRTFWVTGHHNPETDEYHLYITTLRTSRSHRPRSPRCTPPSGRSKGAFGN